MSVDLKQFFDAARASSDEVERIMAEMNAAFSEGTEEGREKALALRPGLEAAQKKAEEDNALYLSLRNGAGAVDSAARQFVPVEAVPMGDGGAEKKNTITRAEFAEMSAADRMEFVKGGGKLTD